MTMILNKFEELHDLDQLTSSQLNRHGLNSRVYGNLIFKSCILFLKFLSKSYFISLSTK